RNILRDDVRDLETLVGAHQAQKAGHEQSAGNQQHRAQRDFEAMVALEVALSTVLLIAGGLLMASFLRLMRTDQGFEVAHVITQDVSFLSPKYSHGARVGAIAELEAQLAAIPGVEAVGASSQLPLLGEDWISGLRDTDAAEPRT